MRRVRVFLLLYFLSGAAALLYEVVWLRLLALSMGHGQAAVERFSEALFLYPTLAPALDGLAQASEQQGQTRRAATVRTVRGPGSLIPYFGLFGAGQLCSREYA